ncbi:hypothetical protein EYF80_019342 [Liparis tanakae]|uniref:Uncharacterized protein n=1 Tax=Liparis tanakae TaxID=230148 RepID=A0A4Z2HYR2_9TELE|nr:hypothetical protein EYF80_019342 [Liparis tanakae]
MDEMKGADGLWLTGMSSLHSLSEAGGDSFRSGKSSLLLGPRKRILSRRFSMVNTAHLGFTLTWRTATLRGHRTQGLLLEDGTSNSVTAMRTTSYQSSGKQLTAAADLLS